MSTVRRPLAILASLAAMAAAFTRVGASQAYENEHQGARIEAAIATTKVGDALLGELGGASAGIRSYRHESLLFAWELQGGVRGGWLAQQHPFLSLFGIHARAWGELGKRMLPRAPWSPYFGVRAGNELSVMGHPGLSMSALGTVNSVDGVGGVVAQGWARLSAGVSHLSGDMSLIVSAFGQGDLTRAQVYTPARAFAEAGVSLRLDFAQAFLLEFESSVGVGAIRDDARLGSHDTPYHARTALSARKIFRSGMWIGGEVLLDHIADAIRYDVGATYHTSEAPTLGVSLSFGLPLWRRAP